MDVRLAAVMTGLPLVQGFTARGTQRLLERGEVRLYLAGAVLFKQGDPPAFVVLVLHGEIQVFVDRDGDNMVLVDVGPGHHSWRAVGSLRRCAGRFGAALRSGNCTAMECAGCPQYATASSVAVGSNFHGIAARAGGESTVVDRFDGSALAQHRQTKRIARSA